MRRTLSPNGEGGLQQTGWSRESATALSAPALAADSIEWAGILGGFYTQADIKDIIAYAADRGVCVVFPFRRVFAVSSSFCLYAPVAV